MNCENRLRQIITERSTDMASLICGRQVIMPNKKEKRKTIRFYQPFNLLPSQIPLPLLSIPQEH
jgi:hypothetical protein